MIFFLADISSFSFTYSVSPLISMVHVPEISPVIKEDTNHVWTSSNAQREEVANRKDGT